MFHEAYEPLRVNRLLVRIRYFVCVFSGDTDNNFSNRAILKCIAVSFVTNCYFHRFCLCFCMSEVISSFKSLRVGSQVFSLLMLFLCVILHTMFSGKSMQLLCILPFGMLCLSAISIMFIQIMCLP